MTSERRRYFRIDEAVGIAYEVLDGHEEGEDPASVPLQPLELIKQQDEKIEKLLLDLADSQPAIAELMSLLNQKLERLTQHLSMDEHLVKRLAHRVREANISACGIAFINETPITIGARLALDLKLYPDDQHILTKGIVVACDDDEESGLYYWRIDFIGLSHANHEALIQHVVRNQGAQIKSMRDSRA